MIIAHLTYDTRSLLACSLTCYSWYIATVPHLHDALISPSEFECRINRFFWPKPLPHMHRLGLLPLVRKLQIRERRNYCPYRFSPKRLNRRTLHHFLALTGVRELGIDCLDIPSFMPRIQKYFGHLAQTVRSLSLREPKGSDRQIIYFIGLFEHLEDLKLLHDDMNNPPERGPAEYQELVPLFSPPLQGQLKMTRFARVGILKGMIDLFGGIRFRHVDICNVDGTRLLLEACAKSLESLRLYPTDSHGKELSLSRVGMFADKWTAQFLLGDFDLSQNKSLRSLQVAASSIDGKLMFGSLYQAPTDLLTYALSTITSPVFSEVTVFYRDYDFRGTPSRIRPFCMMLPDERAEDDLWHYRRFEVFRKMRKVRDFRLVLCADVWDRIGLYSVLKLTRR